MSNEGMPAVTNEDMPAAPCQTRACQRWQTRTCQQPHVKRGHASGDRWGHASNPVSNEGMPEVTDEDMPAAPCQMRACRHWQTRTCQQPDVKWGQSSSDKRGHARSPMSNEGMPAVIFLRQGGMRLPEGSSPELQCGLKEYLVRVYLSVHTSHISKQWKSSWLCGRGRLTSDLAQSHAIVYWELAAGTTEESKSSAVTCRRHCSSHRTLHHSVQLCDRL